MGEPINTESKPMVAKVWGEKGEWGVTVNGCKVSFGGDKNVLELDRGDGCVTL